MKIIRRLILVVASLAVDSVASAIERDSMLTNLTFPLIAKLKSLDGYPGVLTREAVQSTVNEEIRNQVTAWAFQGNNSLKIEPKVRHLSSSDGSSDSDFTGLNEILKTFVINIPQQNITQDIIGVTATVNITGRCGDIQLDRIWLDYEKGSSSSLTYFIAIENLDVKCQIEVLWDLGVLDIGDFLKIKLVLADNQFQIAVTLQGSPPDTATFSGCEVLVNVASIDSSGGFSSDILNELSDLIIEIVRVETEALSDLICGFILDFTSVVDAQLIALGNTLAPYLTKVKSVDPLQLEKDLKVTVQVLDLTDSTLGDVLQVFITNLQGVIGAYQINTFIELNVLNNNGILEILPNLRRRRLQTVSDCLPSFGRRYLKKSNPMLAMIQKVQLVLEDELTDLLEPIFPEHFQRKLQVLDTENLFVLNSFNLTSIEIGGLNTFKDTMYLQIIGKQTLRTELELEGLFFQVKFIIDFDVNGLNRVEKIAATIPIEDITVVASYLIGLDNDKVNSIKLADLVNTTSLLPCLQWTLVAAGVSQLDVTVGRVGDAIVDGVIDTGVDEVINTAVEAVICTYQDLILDAVPNIFQNNVTVLANDFLECYIRTVASQSVCVSSASASIIETLDLFGDDSGSSSGGGGGGGSSSSSSGSSAESMEFDFGSGTTTEFYAGAESDGLTDTSTATLSAYVVNSSTSNTGAATTSGVKFVSFLGSGGVDELALGFIDFRDLLLPSNESKSLGGSGAQPYGDLISLAFSTVRDRLASTDNTTSMPTINTDVMLPLTEAQSGVRGMFRFADQLLNFTFDSSTAFGPLMRGVKIRLFNATISNVDTIVNPFSFLQPTDEAHVLENILHFGPVSGRPLAASIGLGLDIGRENAPITLINNLGLSAMITELDVLASLRIMIPAVRFLQFPLTDILNLNCWLALFQAPAMSPKASATVNSGMTMSNFLAKLSSMSIQMECLNCTSTLLPKVIEILKSVGAIKSFGNRMSLLLEDVLTEEMASSFLTDLVGLGEAAASLCPHSPYFNTSVSNEAELAIRIPPLSNRSIDTLVFTAVLASELLLTLFVESHMKTPNVTSLVAQYSSAHQEDVADDESQLDWTKLNETFVPFASDLLEMVRGMVGLQDTGLIGVNQVLGDFLAGDGSYLFGFDDIAFEFAGLALSLHSIQMYGLNSFSHFDILRPVTPHTLQNVIQLDRLSLKVDVSIQVASTKDPPRSFSVSIDVGDMNMTSTLFALIDMESLAALEIGSLIFVENILPCVLSTARDIHVASMLVSLGNLSNPIVEGLLPDTEEAISRSLAGLFNTLGTDLVRAINAVIGDVLKVLVNNFLATSLNGTECTSFNGSGANGVIDFRDLLLPPEDAQRLGGSGSQPYGDFFSKVFSKLQGGILKAGENEGLLELNNMAVDPFTESQSGTEGWLHFPMEIFSYSLDLFSNFPLASLEEWLSTRFFDIRFGNVNTLVGPLSVLEPTHEAYVLENMINFGPVNGHSINTTVGVSFGLEGGLTSMNMYNEFDITASAREVEVFADIGLHLAESNFFQFPLRDLMKMNCWLAMIQMPSSNQALGNVAGFELNANLLRLVSLSLALKCRNCTSTILPKLVGLLNDAGVSEVVGNRAGPFFQELSSSSWFQSVINGFVPIGADAARMCPHSALYGEDSPDSTATPTFPPFPPLSDLSLDSMLFAATIAAEMVAILIAENHVRVASQTETKTFDEELPEVPDGSKALDWRNLSSSEVPFIEQFFNFVQNSLNGYSKSAVPSLKVNSIMAGVLGSEGRLDLPFGNVSFEAHEFKLTFHGLRLEGLTSFSNFQMLHASSPQVLANNFTLDKLSIGLNSSIEILASADPPKHIDFLLKLEDIKVSMPLYVAVDGDQLAAITISSLLHTSNIIPCLMSAVSGVLVPEMLLSVGSIRGIAIHGLLPDTGGALSNSTNAVLDHFGGVILESLPIFVDGTVKEAINQYLLGLKRVECQVSVIDTSPTYVDFRELFAAPSKGASNKYGDFIPTIKRIVDSVLHSLNTNTGLLEVNNMLIAPVTASQSGIEGTIAFTGVVFGHSFGGLEELGIDQISFELMDARIENLDTIGLPLKILEPNASNGFLLDNSATFGTELRPLRFVIKPRLRFMGSLLNTHDEMEIFASLNRFPFLAVILAKLGAQELLTYPLKYIADYHCWLATLATPTLTAIASGQSQVDPVLALEYIEVIFSSLHIGATCLECSTPGLVILPELLDIVDASGSKDILGRRILEAAVELLQSDFVQIWLLRYLQDSMRQCPRTAALEKNNIVLASPEFPAITPQSLETIVFGAYVLSSVAIVLLAETISVLETSSLEPIFKNDDPEFPPETRLVDFTALDTYPVGGLVKYFLEGINSYLGDPSTDPVTGETTLAINELLGENPLYSLDTFAMQFEDLGTSFGSFNVSLLSFEVSGIDTFTSFHFLDIAGPTSLHNKLGWEKVQLQMSLEIEFIQQEGSAQIGQKSNFTLTLEATKIEAFVDILLALDYELLKNLQIGSLLRMAHIFPCIQAAIRHMEVSEIKVEIGQITNMHLTGFNSQETSMAAESLEKLVLARFGTVLADAAPSVFSVAVRPLLNSVIDSYLRRSNFSCDQFSFETESTGFIDFRDFFLSPFQSRRYGGSGAAQYGDLIRTAYGILQLGLSNAHPENGIEMLKPVVSGLSFPGVLLNQGIRFDVRQLHADISFRVSDLEITNLDSIGSPLSILAPVKEEPHQLNNTGTFGISNRPLTMSARMYMHIKGFGGADIVNDFDLSLDIHSATIILTVLLKVSEDGFVKFPLRDILNINCWIALIPPPELDEYGFRGPGSDLTAALMNLDVVSSKLNLALHCHNCTSPAVLKLAELLEGPGSSDDITHLANELIASVTHRLGGAFLQDQINRLLVQAPRQCSHRDGFDPESKPIVYDMFKPVNEPRNLYLPIMMLIFAPIMVALAAAFLVRRLVSRRQQKWLSSLPSEQIFLLQQKQESDDQQEAGMNHLSKSMHRSDEIPFVVRKVIPIVIVVNIGFFLSGHLNDGGRVLINFIIAGETFQLDDFFIFSIGQSTIDMWHAGGKELALLILLVSGVWPYTKQLITLALWYLPPSVVSCGRRGQFLLWLDILAKWSMLDIIVMVITIAGFRVSITSPNLVFVPKDFYAIHLVVAPMWGLYANMIAQLITQISSHFIVHYHRRIVQNAKVRYLNQLTQQRSESEASPTSERRVLQPCNEQMDQGEIVKHQLCHHSFWREQRAPGERLVVRRFVNIVLLMGSLMLCVLLVVSCDIPSMRLEALGIVGLLMELGQDLKPAVRYEGVFSIARLLVDQAAFLGGVRNYIGLGFLAFLFLATVLLVPILQIMTLLFHWFAPLTAKQARNVAALLEILQAWQYSEVYILAVIIESWQLGSISQLMLNKFCTSLDFTLNLLTYYGVLDKSDAQCFALEASIEAGTYLLVPLAAGLALLNTFVVKAYIQQLREKEEANYSIPEDEKLRAFDRTTWDSRSEALQTIRSPEIHFTDTFRWALRRHRNDNVRKDSFKKKAAPKNTQTLEDKTSALGRTLHSDEEHGDDIRTEQIGDDNPGKSFEE